jgi:hypothetical protein
MFEIWKQFFASSNGDRWFLGRLSSRSQTAAVAHRANLSSGGAETVLEVPAFLLKDVGSPQRDALLDLLKGSAREAETPDADHFTFPTHATPPIAIDAEVAYEPGMQIIWDVLTREVFVIFRGMVTSAGQGFETREKGIAEGEQICRNSGWNGGMGTQSAWSCAN